MTKKWVPIEFPAANQWGDNFNGEECMASLELGSRIMDPRHGERHDITYPEPIIFDVIEENWVNAELAKIGFSDEVQSSAKQEKNYKYQFLDVAKIFEICEVLDVMICRVCQFLAEHGSRVITLGAVSFLHSKTALQLSTPLLRVPIEILLATCERVLRLQSMAGVAADNRRAMQCCRLIAFQLRTGLAAHPLAEVNDNDKGAEITLRSLQHLVLLPLWSYAHNGKLPPAAHQRAALAIVAAAAAAEWIPHSFTHRYRSRLEVIAAIASLAELPETADIAKTLRTMQEGRESLKWVLLSSRFFKTEWTKLDRNEEDPGPSHPLLSEIPYKQTPAKWRDARGGVQVNSKFLNPALVDWAESTDPLLCNSAVQPRTFTGSLVMVAFLLDSLFVILPLAFYSALSVDADDTLFTALSVLTTTAPSAGGLIAEVMERRDSRDSFQPPSIVTARPCIGRQINVLGHVISALAFMTGICCGPPMCRALGHKFSGDLERWAVAMYRGYLPLRLQNVYDEDATIMNALLGDYQLDLQGNEIVGRAWDITATARRVSLFLRLSNSRHKDEWLQEQDPPDETRTFFALSRLTSAVGEILRSTSPPGFAAISQSLLRIPTGPWFSECRGVLETTSMEPVADSSDLIRATMTELRQLLDGDTEELPVDTPSLGTFFANLHLDASAWKGLFVVGVLPPGFLSTPTERIAWLSRAPHESGEVQARVKIPSNFRSFVGENEEQPWTEGSAGGSDHHQPGILATASAAGMSPSSFLGISEADWEDIPQPPPVTIPRMPSSVKSSVLLHLMLEIHKGIVIRQGLLSGLLIGDSHSWLATAVSAVLKLAAAVYAAGLAVSDEPGPSIFGVRAAEYLGFALQNLRDALALLRWGENQEIDDFENGDRYLYANFFSEALREISLCRISAVVKRLCLTYAELDGNGRGIARLNFLLAAYGNAIIVMDESNDFEQLKEFVEGQPTEFPERLWGDLETISGNVWHRTPKINGSKSISTESWNVVDFNLIEL